MSARTAALVGVAGGAGTTRTAVELAGALSRAGRSVLVFDLDFATQGLSQSVRGRIDPDATALLTDPEASLADATVAWDVPDEGVLDVVAAHAPFVDVAAAKAPAAAERVADRLLEATDRYDHVLLDVPPIAANQAIAGVDAADRVAAVLPPTDRGLDSLQRTKGRLADVGATLDVTIATRTSGSGAPDDVDAALPDLPAKPAPDRPAVLDGEGQWVDAVAETAARLLDVQLAVDATTAPGLFDRLRRSFT